MSKIEQIITEIEEYVDSCQFQPFSNKKIIVEKDVLDEMLAELRLRTPDEIKKYQKIIANRDAILNDAKEKADAMMTEATAQINQLVSEHEIMQKAYAEANQIVEQAQKQAQDTINQANGEANDLRNRAMQYTDDILANVQSILANSMNEFDSAQNSLISSLNSSFNVVVESRKELTGTSEEDGDYDDDNITVDLEQ